MGATGLKGVAMSPAEQFDLCEDSARLRVHTSSFMLQQQPFMHPDLEEARKHYGALRTLIICHLGGWADEQALDQVITLTRAAKAVIDDLECHEKLDLARNYAGEVFSEDGHKKWDRASMTGVDFLRLQTLQVLDAFHNRLFAIEAMRRVELRDRARKVGKPDRRTQS
jgi:hypothetical protein